MKKLSIAVLLILLIPVVTAFGVSPGEIDLGELNPGGYSEAQLVLSSVAAAEWNVSLEATGEHSGWIHFDPSEAPISFGNPISATIAVAAPADAAPGAYEERVLIRFEPPGHEGGEKHSTVMYQLNVPVRFVVTGDRKASCIVGGLRISAAEEGQEASVSYTIKNTGTVRVSPVFTLSFLDETGNIRLAETWTAAEILPTSTEQDDYTFTMMLPAGEYEVQVSSPSCDFESFSEYAVAAPGSLSRGGELESLTVEDVVGPLPVHAQFRNTGETVVEARLSGVVLDDTGKVVAIFESEPLLALPGERVAFKEFVDVIPGEYIVRAKILYEGDVSAEREVQVVAGEADEQSTPLQFVAIIFFAVVIIVLVVMISEKKNIGMKRRRR